MFSFGKKKKEPKKRPPRPSNANKSPFDEFGVGPQPDDDELEAELQAITGFQPSMDSPIIGEDDDDDVEVELMRLIGKSKKSSKQVDKVIPQLKDIKSESFTGSIDENEDIDVDENDPDLLNELLELTNPDQELPDEEDESSETEESSSKEEPDILTILNERLEMYKTAELKAKENNESSRARRFNRGIKTIQDLIKKAEKGQQILMGDIPPLIATNLKPPPPKNEETEGQTESLVNKPDGDGNVSQQQGEEMREKQPGPKLNENRGGREIKKMPTPEPEPRPQPKFSPEPKPLPKLPSEPRTPPKLPLKPPAQILNNDESKPKPEIPPREKPKLNIVNLPDTSKKSTPTEDPHLASLKSQREKYKSLALEAKKNNDMQAALENVKKVKEITAKIAAIENGEPSKPETSTSLPSPTKTSKPNISPKRKPTSPGSSTPVNTMIFDTPRTVLEALEQRLRIYNDLLQKCEKQNDKISAMKNRKIVQIYIDAIRLHKLGKKVPLQKLPTPAGCPPIPQTF